MISDNLLGIDEFFCPGKELVISEDGDRLIKDVMFYLENEKDRNRIARAGYEKVMREHIIGLRSQQVKKIIEDKLLEIY